jgi:3-isopropylmalate dehydratase small subunit
VERALAKVDLGGLGDYERGGGFAPLYSSESLLKLARVEGRLLLLALVWECGASRKSAPWARGKAR